ncbi:MAG: capsular polysaccharide synthesis protein [Streptosporangiaceae bacterium]
MNIEVEGTTRAIPQTIWVLWFQRLDKAPYVVRKCHESWVAKNPGWQVVTLDDETLPRYASADYHAGNLATMLLQHRSDLVRLDLLTRHGGAWIDATCCCVQPLDDWLWPNTRSGFFAFDRPGYDRLISSWFLAAEPKNVLMSRLYDQMLAYWGDHPLRGARQQFKVKALTHLLRRTPRTRGWWFSRPVTDWLVIAPYYALHYGFEKLIRDDPDCARIWEQTPKISALPSHRLHEVGLLSPVSDAVRSEIDRRTTPLYKTAWNLKGQAIPDDSNLGYLLND